MIIIGLDLSLSDTGICIYDTDTKEYYYKSIQTKKNNNKYNEQERIKTIRSEIVKILFIYIKHYYDVKNIKVIIEGYAFLNTNNASHLIELGGIIKQMLFGMQIDFEIVPPLKWKKEVLGKGNLKKDEIKQKVKEIFGIEFDNQNICDAFCLVQYYLKK